MAADEDLWPEVFLAGLCRLAAFLDWLEAGMTLKIDAS